MNVEIFGGGDRSFSRCDRGFQAVFLIVTHWFRRAHYTNCLLDSSTVMDSKKKYDKPNEQSDAESNSACLSNLAEAEVASALESNTSDSVSSIASLVDVTSTTKNESDQEPPMCYYVGNHFHVEEGSELPYSEAMPTHLSASTIEGDRQDPATVVAGSKPNALATGSAASTKLEGLNSVKSDTVRNQFSRLPFDSRSHPSGASSNFSKSTNKSQPPNPLKKVIEFGSDHQSAGITKRGYTLRKFSSLSNMGPGQTPNKGPLSCGSSNRTWDRYEKSEFNGDGNFRNLKEPNCGPRALRSNTTLSSSFKKDQLGPLSCGSSNWTWDGYEKSEFNGDGNFRNLKEPNRGPRARSNTTLSSSFKKDQLGLMVKRDHYNRQDFETIYENAKFFVIKSYSEDDIHKSIKYNVWSSTPNGNKKLDAAFHDAGLRSNESDATCPLFLFFSVNGSGQFLGVAEMVGQVDFKKDMDFWQEDKWNGFFPVKWHIIKDIPNSYLRHIILENNDNRPVTRTRDTQEIEFKQGLEMLAIFKGYRARTSILDDFSYYENQKVIHGKGNSQAASSPIDTYWTPFPEKKIHEKRGSMAASSQNDTDRTKFLQQQQSGAGLRRAEHESMWIKRSFNSKTSLTTPTKNLPLTSHLLRTSSGKNSARP